MDTSIIMPAINEAARITVAVRAARRLPVAEVIVVDGGSDDGTAGRAAAAGATVIAHHRAGRGIQQTVGARAARGALLLFLHADAQLAQPSIEQVQQAVRQQAAWGCFRQRIGDRRRVFRFIERGNAWRARRLGWVYGDQALWVLRDAFFQVGGFPDEPLLEDLLLSGQLKRRFGPPRLLPGPLWVDARRWRRQGPLRQTWLNWSILARFHLLGHSPSRLANCYRRHDIR